MRLAMRGSYNVWLRLGVLALCFLVPGAERLFSQADTGSITGTVTDPAGAVLTNVKITIIAVATNRHLSVITDNEGRYSSGPLRVGEYRSKPNCRALNIWFARRSCCRSSRRAVVNLQMELGTVTQETTVTAAEELVRTVGRFTGRGDRGAQSQRPAAERTRLPAALPAFRGHARPSRPGPYCDRHQ